GALAEIMACLTDRDARPAGGGADAGDRRVHGVVPEVVGLPVGDLLQQVRLGPAVDGRRGQDRVLELRVLPSVEGALGQEPLPQPLQGQRLGPAGTAPLQRVGGQVKEHLAGERVVARVQGCELAQHLEDASVAGEPVEQSTTGGRRVLGSWPLPAGHVTTVAHNRQPRAAFVAGHPAPRQCNAAKPAYWLHWVVASPFTRRPLTAYLRIWGRRCGLAGLGCLVVALRGPGGRGSVTACRPSGPGFRTTCRPAGT